MKLVLFMTVLLVGFSIPNVPNIPGAALASFAPLPQVSSAPLTPNPVGQPGSWQLVYRDEFSSSSLNTSKWVTCYWWASTGCTITNDSELEWYQPSQVLLSGGALHLRADKKTVTGDGKTYNYVSGMVSTGQIASTGLPAKFTFTYGYVEGRVQIPAGQGFWSTFWMIPLDRSWPPEIDIFEILGNATTTDNMHFHYTDSSGALQDSGATYTGPNFSSGYHVFGIDWEPTAITWYVDGVQVRNFTNAAYIPNKPFYVLANLAVGGNWPGAPNSATPFPSDMKVDYVRIWKKSGP